MRHFLVLGLSVLTGCSLLFQPGDELADSAGGDAQVDAGLDVGEADARVAEPARVELRVELGTVCTNAFVSLGTKQADRFLGSCDQGDPPCNCTGPSAPCMIAVPVGERLEVSASDTADWTGSASSAQCPLGQQCLTEPIEVAPEPVLWLDMLCNS